MKVPNRKRNKQIKFYASIEEAGKIEQLCNKLGMKKQELFLYLIKQELKEN